MIRIVCEDNGKLWWASSHDSPNPLKFNTVSDAKSYLTLNSHDYSVTTEFHIIERKSYAKVKVIRTRQILFDGE